MKKAIIGCAVLTSLVSLNVFADAQGEVCQGGSASGATWTITVSQDNRTISVNANGKRVTYKVHAGSGSSDVSYAYESNNGQLRATFYDQDNSVSGWSSELGAFKGTCK